MSLSRFCSRATHPLRHVQANGRRFASTTPDNPLRQATKSKWLPVAGAVVVGASLFFFNPAEKHRHRFDDLRPIQSRFVHSQVVSSHFSGADTKLLKLKAPPEFKGTLGSIWSVFIKDDDIQVERPYTPLEGIDGEGNMLFWIKRYEHGEVGRWLHSKQTGDKIEFRGPLQTWKWEEDKWDEVIMVSFEDELCTIYCLSLCTDIWRNRYYTILSALS